jgi:polar amino acid transport system substrate-binding protein
MKSLLPLAIALCLLSCATGGEKAAQLSSEADLAGLRVATRTGSCYALALAERDDIDLRVFNTEADLIQSVMSGYADVLVQDEVTFNSEVCREYGIRMAFKTTLQFPTAFMFRKGDTTLVEAMNTVRKTLEEDGTMKTLKDFWLTDAYLDNKTYRHIPAETEGEPLRVAVVTNVAPIAFMIGDEWYGLEIDLARALSLYLHRPLECKLYDISGMMAVKNGTADLLLGCLFVTPERQQEFSFSEPYHYFHGAYYLPDSGAKEEAEAGLLSRLKRSFRRNFLVEDRWKYITSGLLQTLKITLGAILLGALLGVGLCAMTRSRRKWLRNSAAVYGWFMRGIPLLVLLLILFYVVFAGSGLSPVMVAIIAFAMDFGAGAGRIYTTSLEAIPRGQTEAGLALGFTRLQTFFHIILPQAAKRGLPLFRAQCISTLKGTSIVGYIAIQDLTRAGDMIRSRTFDAFFPLLVVTVVYFLLARLIILLLQLASPKKQAL